MKTARLEKAAGLYKAASYREAAAEFRCEAMQATAFIEGLQKDLDAAELAAAAWTGYVAALLALPDEEWTTADGEAARVGVNGMLDIAKLIKKRYAPKVEILFDAAQFLLVLEQEDEARIHLAAGSRFYDQQLAHLAAPPYPDKAVVSLKKKREKLERDLLTKQHPQTAKVVIEAVSTLDLEIALEALRTGKGTWVVPDTYRDRRTSHDSRAGRRFLATAKVTLNVGLRPAAPPPEVDLTSPTSVKAAIARGEDIWFEAEYGWTQARLARVRDGVLELRETRDDEWEEVNLPDQVSCGGPGE